MDLLCRVYIEHGGVCALMIVQWVIDRGIILVKDYFTRMIKAVAMCAGPRLCVVVIQIIISFLIFGVALLASFPLCGALYFGTEEPYTIILPNLHNLSSSERFSLLAGRYKLSSKYNLQLTQDAYTLQRKFCIIKRHYTRISACVEIGTGMLENTWICNPDKRPDSLPSAIVGHWFGVSLCYPGESTVVYTVVNIESSAISGNFVMTNTTSLSAVWYDMFGCQSYVNLAIAVIFFGSLIFIGCLGCAGWCLRIYCELWKEECCTLAVRYRQLRRQEQDDEIALTIYEASEGSCSERSELFEEDTDEKPFSLVPSELQGGLSDAGQSCSSGEEEEVQVEVHLLGGVSSRESVRTAVSERGHRKHGRRSRCVQSKRPLVGYFTDSSSMSGAATDVSMNDASDEESSDEAGPHLNGQLSSSSSSSSVTPRVQEASGVGTPPPFAHFHPTTVYDHRPGVTTEPRRPPDGI